MVPADYETHFAKFLREYIRGQMTIDLVVVEEMMGSADGLRAVSDRLRGDFFCLSADFISQFSLSDLTNLHRLSTSDITITMVQSPKDGSKDDIDQEYLGICDNGRVLMKTPALEIDGGITLSKALLHRAGRFRLRNDLSDIGIYLMSHWLLEFVTSNKRISSIRNDLLPFVINRQFQPKEYLVEHIPAIEHRKRALAALETYETRTDHGAGQDLLRCFALVYEPNAGAAANASAPALIVSRLTTLASYLALNKDIPLHQYTSRTPWARASGYMKKEMTVLGEGTDVSDKTITVKQCSIGANVKIGAKTKLNNCIIMDNASIGENCTVQNSIICDRVVIESGCNLNECNVGSGYRVVAATKVRGESFSTVSQASI